MNDFDDFQKRQGDIFQTEKAIEYLALKLTSHTGRLAREAAHVARGDYEGKGAIIYQEIVEDILDECSEIMRYVALITTVLERKLSDVIVHGAEARKQHTL
jgi:hypothetical protein